MKIKGTLPLLHDQTAHTRRDGWTGVGLVDTCVWEEFVWRTHEAPAGDIVLGL